MSAQEIIVENYMQALLKAALLLGDLHHSEPITELSFPSFATVTTYAYYTPNVPSSANRKLCRRK